jgi:hypothetical protein
MDARVDFGCKQFQIQHRFFVTTNVVVAFSLGAFDRQKSQSNSDAEGGRVV